MKAKKPNVNRGLLGPCKLLLHVLGYKLAAFYSIRFMLFFFKIKATKGRKSTVLSRFEKHSKNISNVHAMLFNKYAVMIG